MHLDVCNKMKVREEHLLKCSAKIWSCLSAKTLEAAVPTRQKENNIFF